MGTNVTSRNLIVMGKGADSSTVGGVDYLNVLVNRKTKEMTADATEEKNRTAKGDRSYSPRRHCIPPPVAQHRVLFLCFWYISDSQHCTVWCCFAAHVCTPAGRQLFLLRRFQRCAAHRTRRAAAHQSFPAQHHSRSSCFGISVASPHSS